MHVLLMDAIPSADDCRSLHIDRHPVSMPAQIRIKMPASIIVAQILPQPHRAVERTVANRLGRQCCQALAAAGGGQRPGFTTLVT
jgi:hypothetical protein